MSISFYTVVETLNLVVKFRRNVTALMKCLIIEKCRIKFFVFHLQNVRYGAILLLGVARSYTFLITGKGWFDVPFWLINQIVI